MQVSISPSSVEVAPDQWTALRRLELIELILPIADRNARQNILSTAGVSAEILMSWVDMLQAIEKVAGRQCHPQPRGKKTMQEGEMERAERVLLSLQGGISSANAALHAAGENIPASMLALVGRLHQDLRGRYVKLFEVAELHKDARTTGDWYTDTFRDAFMSLRNFMMDNGITTQPILEYFNISPSTVSFWRRTQKEVPSTNDHDANSAHDTTPRRTAVTLREGNNDGNIVFHKIESPSPATSVVEAFPPAKEPYAEDLSTLSSLVSDTDVDVETNGHTPAKKASRRRVLHAEKEGQPPWVREAVDSRPIDADEMQERRERAEAIRQNAGLIIEGDERMEDVWTKTLLASRSNGQVLIRGETGTGKELIFRSIHELRKNGEKMPSAQVNCAAIPKDLAESILFGHKKGAFTGAHEDRKGLFHVVSEGGTLFLDEIGDMEPVLQAKLLRVIQDRKFSAVGETTEVPLSPKTKIVASTHRNLESMMRGRRFREDLFHRLSGQQIFVPPLRERSSEHKTALIGHFLQKISDETQRQTFMTMEAFQAMLAFEHTGNVRQLSNHIRSAAGFSGLETEGEVLIDATHVNAIFEHANVLGSPDVVRKSYFDRILRIGHDAHGAVHFSVNVRDMDAAAGSVTLARLLEAIDTAIISAAVEENGGVQSKAADQIGLTRGTIRDRLTRAPEILVPDTVQDD
jgi:transcriptional regulator with PAS, ATPase and Fis domain